VKCLSSVKDNSWNLHCITKILCGLGSIVGIATGYGLDVLGIESWWGQDFSHLSRPALGPTQPRDADPSPPSSAVVKKE